MCDLRSGRNTITYFARERLVIYKYCKEELNRLTVLWLATQKPKLAEEFQQTTQLRENGTETVNMWAEENYYKVCKDTACASWGASLRP